MNPDVQKLLEILITKRVELRNLEEEERKEVEAGFWIIKGKPEQLLGPEKAPYPGTLGTYRGHAATSSGVSLFCTVSL